MKNVEFIKGIRQAIKEDNLQEVERLIGNDKEKLNTVTPLGSWLHEAARFGYVDLAEKLIDMGIDLNLECKNIKGSALTEAARAGQIEMMKLLRKRGLEYDLRDTDRNPLFRAIAADQIGMVKYLVDTGIDITVNYSDDEDDPWDALRIASDYGKEEIVNILKTALNK
ncbi:ankyrin repeat domain-containing protein [Clostridium butyricum]|uniref:ankyrin repeat domain-containing protein n=1 Tax=Clostridium butyricum TaxID=1492 RepID=UPI00374F8EAE